MSSSIPNPRTPVASIPDGLISREWYRFLSQLSTAFSSSSGDSETRSIALVETPVGAVTRPVVGSQTLFIDSADHKLKRMDATGTVTIIG